MLNPLPILANERKLKLLPMFIVHKVEATDPSLAKDRIDMVEPISHWPTQESFMQLPKCVMPKTVKQEPNRFKARTDKLDPPATMSKALKLDPSRANDRTETEEPLTPKSNTETLEPRRANDRTDIELPNCACSKLLKAEPSRANERRLMPEPNSMAPATDNL